jgi:hypothetical protein
MLMGYLTNGRAYSNPMKGRILTPDADEIEELVRIAAQENSHAARYRLFRALPHVELFFPLKVRRHRGKEVRATPLLRLQDGSNAMMLYTSKSHPDLPDSFGGGAFKDALAAAQKMSALDWVILSNRASQSVSVRKEHIPSILNELDSEEKKETVPQADESLEDLITRAVHSAPEELSAPINSALAGRELYLEMIAGHGEQSQPTMNIFQVHGMPNVLRAYLTRRRPGITYGGIKWEALKEMIMGEAAINGVQIVNDADDWVAFDRESLKRGPIEGSS